MRGLEGVGKQKGDKSGHCANVELGRLVRGPDVASSHEASSHSRSLAHKLTQSLANILFHSLSTEQPVLVKRFRLGVLNSKM